MYDSSNQQNFTNSSTIYVNSGIEFPLVPANVGSNWSSSNTSVATVDDDGIITTLSPGTTTITASVSTIATYSMTLEVLLPDGDYFIKNLQFPDKYMQLDNNGNDFLELHDFDGDDDQIWEITHFGEGYYTIKSLSNNMYVTAQNISGMTINLATYTGNNNQKWKIIKLLNGDYNFSSMSILNNHISAAGTVLGSGDGRNIELETPQNDGKDEWKLYQLNSVIRLDVMYDGGYAARYSNSTTRIDEHLTMLRKKYWDDFQIFVKIQSVTSIQSYADTECDDPYNETCSHFPDAQCFNSTSTNSLSIGHHKNLTNILLRIPSPNMDETIKLVYIGHEICLCEHEEIPSTLYTHYPHPVNGLAYPTLGLIGITNFNSVNDATKTTVHEIGHMYGIIDHYGYMCPSTNEMNNGRNIYSRDCIYGENKDNSNIIDNITICEGCKMTITQNKLNFQHSLEG